MGMQEPAEYAGGTRQGHREVESISNKDRHRVESTGDTRRVLGTRGHIIIRGHRQVESTGDTDRYEDADR